MVLGSTQLCAHFVAFITTVIKHANILLGSRKAGRDSPGDISWLLSMPTASGPVRPVASLTYGPGSSTLAIVIIRSPYTVPSTKVMWWTGMLT